LKSYMKKVWWRYLLGISTLVLTTAADMFFPIVTMLIVDEVIIGKREELLGRYLGYILLLGLVRTICQYVKEYNCDMAGCQIAESMRVNLLRHMNYLSKSYYDRNNIGELMARVKDDTGNVWDVMGFVGMLSLEATLYLIGVIICMVKLHIGLALIPITFLPILAFFVMGMSRRLRKLYENISNKNAELTSVIEENISGVRVVKAFAREDYEIEKFDKQNEIYKESTLEQEFFMAGRDPLVHLIPGIMQAMVLLAGGILVIKGNITYGLLAAFLQYASAIVWPIRNMGWLTNAFSRGVASFKKVEKIMDEKPEIVGAERMLAANENGENENAENGNRENENTDRAVGELKFEHVSLKFKEKQVLDDVSFSVTPGKTLGIMGETGSGKSLLVSLIGRLYDPTDGRITIGGRDMKELSLNAVRGYSSIVTQEVFLFSDTIRENVSLGQKGAIPEVTIKKALDSARASEFVEKLTEKEETVIGERGIGLSGGQKQRLSMARAFAKDAEVLVLDDSTSALDMETEKEVERQLRDKKGMAKVIIAHRISSVRACDEILVMKAGKIVERGTHDELYKLHGAYYETCMAQCVS